MVSRYSIKRQKGRLLSSIVDCLTTSKGMAARAMKPPLNTPQQILVLTVVVADFHLSRVDYRSNTYASRKLVTFHAHPGKGMVYNNCFTTAIVPRRCPNGFVVSKVAIQKMIIISGWRYTMNTEVRIVLPIGILPGKKFSRRHIIIKTYILQHGSVGFQPEGLSQR